MKRFILAAFGWGLGLAVGLAATGGALYWWFEVREPRPPAVVAEFDGFYLHEQGKKWGFRVKVENMHGADVVLADPRLYLMRSDGAIAQLYFEVEGAPITLFAGERQLLLAETGWSTDRAREIRRKQDFDSPRAFHEYKRETTQAFRDAINGFGLFLSDADTRIRIPLDADGWAEMEIKGAEQELATMSDTIIHSDQ